MRQKAEMEASMPRNADSLKLEQAVMLVRSADPMKGIKMLQQLVEADSTNVDAHYYLGEFSMQSGQMPKAIGRFEKVLKLRPDDVKYLVQVGYNYLQMDSLNRSLNCFEKATAIDSTENNALFFIAQICERTGNLEKAKLKYEALLRHNTDAVVDSNVRTYIKNIDIKFKK
ncbi:MAG: tetratricopeptide repeat protein [Flavobacteriales bacterium]